MQLTHDYRRVRANWGSDGDFVTPEGKAIHTGENHTLYMMDHPEMFDGSDDPEDMIGKGWIRTRGYGPIYSIDAGGGMNKTQLDVLQKMVQERCRYSDPQIEVLLDADLYNWSCHDFIMLKYPNQVKRGLRYGSRRVATEQSCWVGPGGEILKLQGHTHAQFAVYYSDMFGNLSDKTQQEALDDDGSNYGDKIVDEVIALGWCRVMVWGNSVDIQFKNQITDSQLSSLKEIVLSVKPNMVYIVGENPRHHAALDYEDFLEAEYFTQLFRMGRFSARAIPFITKEDLRFTKDGDPWVDEDWLESGLKQLLSVNGEHFSYTGKKKRDKDGRAVFLYRAGQMDLWIGKDHKVHREH